MNVEPKGRRSPNGNILAITALVLTLLLTVTVSSFIYFTLTQQHNNINRSARQQETTTSEEVPFYKAETVVVYRTMDGSFASAHDYNKGILYIREHVSGNCFLTPVSSKREDGHGIESYVSVTGIRQSFTVLDGEITDTSFIPETVQKECGEGYQWLVRSPDSDDKTIVKREAPGQPGQAGQAGQAGQPGEDGDGAVSGDDR